MIDQWDIKRQIAMAELDRIVETAPFDRAAAEEQVRKLAAAINETDDHPPFDFDIFDDRNVRQICRNILDAKGFGERRGPKSAGQMTVERRGG